MTTDNYLGNHNLKRSNVPVEFTTEEIKEYIKCSKDPIYFIQTYVRIVNIDKGLVPFIPYTFQEEIINKVVDNRFVICKMPRQSGKSTTIVSMLLWYVLFNENFNIAILANKMQQARELLSRLQLAYEHLPKWLQQGVLEWNKGNIELENGSKIIASATSASAIRGGSFNLIYLDEFAFVQNNMQEEFFASVFPTISSGQTSKVLITSTPNGLNLFYKLWVDSEKGRNSYVRVDVHWSDIPGRDQKWREETIRNTSADQFRVEFECEFIGSSNTLINPAKLKHIPYADAIRRTDDTRIYHEPEKGHLYVIVVDTARGTGNDYSAFVVFDISEVPYKVVATYRNNTIIPLLYPTVIFEAAKFYNEALLLPETNDIGGQIVDILHQDFEYDNILNTVNAGRSGVQLSGGFSSGFIMGVRTTKTVKKLGCLQFKMLVENDKLVINDLDLLQEMYRFTQHGSSYEAEEGNDDLVMCCVLFSWLMGQHYMKNISDVDVRKVLLEENKKMIEDDVLPFGIIDVGIEDERYKIVDI